MRAVIADDFGPMENMTVKEVPDPEPGDGEVLIDVHAVGVNYADLLSIEGKYQSLSKPPFTPGKEVAGEVAAVGSGVGSCKPGDRVMALLEDGGYAERAVAKDNDCYVIPDSVSFVDAAAMMTDYLTAHFALLERGFLKDGETVLINGASGGVGMAAIQLAKAKGATVLAGLSSPATGPTEKEKQAVLKSGADHVIDLTKEDLKNSLRDQVYAITDGRGADVILDPLGDHIFDASLRALAWCGRIVVIGFVAGGVPEIKANYLLIKNITVSGLFFNTYRERETKWTRRVQNEILDYLVAGKVISPVMKTLPLEDFKEALSMIVARQVQGRVILTTR